MFFSSCSLQGSIKGTASGSIISPRTTITTTTAQSISCVSVKRLSLPLAVEGKQVAGGQLAERLAGGGTFLCMPMSLPFGFRIVSSEDGVPFNAAVTCWASQCSYLAERRMLGENEAWGVPIGVWVSHAPGVLGGLSFGGALAAGGPGARRLKTWACPG